MIVLDALRRDRLLEGMKRGKVINLGDATLKREERSGPIVDKVVAERTAEAVAETLSGLLQQVDKPGACCKTNPQPGDEPEPGRIRQQV